MSFAYDFSQKLNRDIIAIGRFVRESYALGKGRRDSRLALATGGYGPTADST
jgi:hypothetical protein